MAGYGALRQDDELPAFPPAPIYVYNNASANYARLCLLVIDVGTPAVAQKVYDNLPPICTTLADALELKFDHLKNLPKKVLNDDQFNLLYPQSGGPVEDEKIDLGLWVILLRNVTGNSRRVNRNWQENPQYWHEEYYHHVQRLKLLRNKLAHPGIRAALNEERFRELWRQADYVLQKLGVSEATISSYLERNIDPEQAGVAVQQVTSQYVKEFNSLLQGARIWSRRQNVIIGIIGSVIIILIIAVVLIVRKKSHWESCADNIRYIEDYALVGYLTRKGWGGREPGPMDHLELPVDYVVISHTAQSTTPCTTTDDCCATVRRLQQINMDKYHWSDIAYNYLIGDTGIVFIGRGPYYVSATAAGWNRKALGFGFIGLFVEDSPTTNAVSALKNYLHFLVDSRIVAANYTMYGLCEIRAKFPDAPGAALMKVLMRQFRRHFKPHNMENCNMNGTSSYP